MTPGPQSYQSAYREALDTDGLDTEGVYVGTSNGQVFASIDGGDHWQRRLVHCRRCSLSPAPSANIVMRQPCAGT